MCLRLVDVGRVARSVLVVVVAACIACTPGTSRTGDGRDARPLSSDEDGEGAAPAWWRWAAQRLRDSRAETGVDTVPAAARLGPGPDEVRPSAEPHDPETLPADVEADEVRDACRVLWLTRQVLPPDGTEDLFAERLRALQGVLGNVQKARVTWTPPDLFGHSDLGFGIRRGSMHVSTRAGVTFSFELAFRGDKLLEVRIECSAPREVAPAVSAALGSAFQPVPSCAGRPAFWRVNYRWLDAWAAARDAMSSALGPALDVPPPVDLSTAYERLTSPFEHLTVWKGSEGSGYEEMEALLGAKRYDLLRQVLHGPNPEGRAYAALALHQSAALDSSDRRAIDALRRASPPIAIGVEGRDDSNRTETADRFFSTLRWPRR